MGIVSSSDHKKRKHWQYITLKAQMMYHPYLEDRTTVTNHLCTTKTGAEI